MKKVYKSKIGPELAVPLTIIFGTVLCLVLSDKRGWAGMAILIPVIFFLVHMFTTTKYIISENNLRVKCGFLFDKTIDINTIKTISATNNPVSSPAASLDRLEIKYGKSYSVIISPKLKKEFIEEITSINPNIEVNLRKK